MNELLKLNYFGDAVSMNCMLSYCNLILTPLSYIQTALIILAFEKLTAHLFDIYERDGCMNMFVDVGLELCNS
jgi:hypothetical protein